jgi:hypothetical protein
MPTEADAARGQACSICTYGFTTGYQSLDAALILWGKAAYWPQVPPHGPVYAGRMFPVTGRQGLMSGSVSMLEPKRQDISGQVIASKEEVFNIRVLCSGRFADFGGRDADRK